MGSSVASFLVLGGGGGGEAPQMYRQKNCNLYARANEASKRPKNIYFQVLKNTSAYIQSMQFPFITYGMALYTTVYNDKTLLIEKNLWICERASLEFFCIFTF